jgi:NAD(P)-dependent dehydrogenase (short-subunit alcohol dehydrogenase family)
MLVSRGCGSIINVGAVGALQGSANMSAYQASKATVMRLTESLSEEVKAAGINVNAVLPSVIDTASNRGAMPEADFDAWVTPTDLGEVICFLGSDAARAVHGALVPVRGLLLIAGMNRKDWGFAAITLRALNSLYREPRCDNHRVCILWT